MGGEEDFWGDFVGGEGMRGRVEEEERSGWSPPGQKLALAAQLCPGGRKGRNKGRPPQCRNILPLL